ncbi:MAG: hypothetical protein O2816_11670, partial [Planctomycetota bacterium]|nr:hypothetical protein [Planctomycetota bacterium]
MRPFLLGLLLALAGLGPFPSPFTPPPRPGPGAWWVADRAGNTVWLLDADLIVVAGFRLCLPVALVPVGDGGVWVLEAIEGTPRGLHRLRRLDPSGAHPRTWILEPPRDVTLVKGVGAVILTRAGALS